MKKNVLLTIASILMMLFAVPIKSVAQKKCKDCTDAGKSSQNKATKPATKPTDDSVARELERLRQENAKLKKKEKRCHKPADSSQKTVDVKPCDCKLAVSPSLMLIRRGDVLDLTVFSSQGCKGVMLKGEDLYSYDPLLQVGKTKKIKHSTTFVATATDSATGTVTEARLHVVPLDEPEVMSTFARTPENLGIFGMQVRQTQPIQIQFVRYENTTWFHRNAWWVVPVGVAVVGGTVGAIVHNNPQIFCHLFDKNKDKPQPDPKPDPLGNSTGTIGVNGEDPGGP